MLQNDRYIIKKYFLRRYKSPYYVKINNVVIINTTIIRGLARIKILFFVFQISAPDVFLLKLNFKVELKNYDAGNTNEIILLDKN